MSAAAGHACSAAVGAAFPDKTPEQRAALMAKILRQFESRRDYLHNYKGMSLSDAGREAARQLGAQVMMAAHVAKRNAALNVLFRVQKTAWVQQNFGNNFARGIESIIAGIQSAKRGTRLSAMSEQASLRREYMGGILQDVEKANVKELFANGSLSRETWLASHAIGDANEAAIHASLPPEAVTIAKIVDKWLEHARVQANDAGAWIGKVDNYVTRQTHNMMRIRAMELPAYKELALRTWDIPRMMSVRGQSNVDDMIAGLFKDFTADYHEHGPAVVGAGTGSRNVGRSLSESRSVFFKDGASSWEYNQMVGGSLDATSGGIWGIKPGNNQSFANAVLGQLENMAQATGLMRHLGPNPQAMVENLKDELRRAARDMGGKVGNANIDTLNKKDNWIDILLKSADGRANEVGSNQVARINQNIRNWTQLVDLGGMLLSQFSDVAQHMSGTAYRGKGYLSGLHEVVTGLFTNLGDADTRKLATSLGVMLEQFAGEITRAGSFDLPGDLSRGVQLFMKWNGAHYWNSHMSYAAAAGLSHDLAADSGRVFAKLDPQMQRVLGQYNIGSAEWDAIRSSALENVHGRNYIVPENVTDKKVADQLRVLISDQTSFGQLEADAKTRAYLLRGTNPGTLNGELLRNMMLFKSFTAAMMQKTIGRELFARGVEHDGGVFSDMGKALVSGNGAFWGMTNVILISTAFGYASMVAKDLAKGIAPQDPSTLKRSDQIAMILRAAQQGGGAGIYGDFLLGQANRMGGTALETAAGPVFGRGAGAINWALKMRDEAAKGEVKPDVAAGLWKGLVSSVPGNNLFYAKWALDYYLNYRIQESLNPGFLQRNEQRLRDQGQHFIVRPQTGWQH